MGHTHPSILDQSCQGATYYKQPILVIKSKTRPITSGNMEIKNACTIRFLEPTTKRILPRTAKICRLPKDSRNTVINASNCDISDTIHSQVPSHPMQQKWLLKLKAPDKKEWACTDGSCITNKENGSQSIGAGVYHPQSYKPTIAHPGGTSINKIIDRADLEGIAAALIYEHPYTIATDSANTQCVCWVLQLLMSACASRHARCAPCRIANIVIFPATLCLFRIILLIMGWLQPDGM